MNLPSFNFAFLIESCNGIDGTNISSNISFNTFGLAVFGPPTNPIICLVELFLHLH